MTPRAIMLRWPAVIAVSAAVAAALYAFEAPPALRVAVIAWFMLVCVGMSFAPLIESRSEPTALIIGIGISLALEGTVVSGLLAADIYSTGTAAAVIGALCLGGCAAQLWSYRTPAPARRSELW